MSLQQLLQRSGIEQAYAQLFELFRRAAGESLLGPFGHHAEALLDHMENEFPEPILREFFADPAGYAELALMLGAAALASIAPARRATRVDPIVALRHE